MRQYRAGLGQPSPAARRRSRHSPEEKVSSSPNCRASGLISSSAPVRRPSHAPTSSRRVALRERVAAHVARSAAPGGRNNASACDWLRRPGFVRNSLGFALDETSTKVSFCRLRVMSTTMEREVCGDMGSLSGEGHTVMKLETVRFATALTPAIDITASCAIAFEHRPSHRRRYAPTASGPRI